MTPDPVYDKLAKFSPDAAAVDASVLLFEAGRASARTPWGWKAAAAALLVANVLSVGYFASRAPERCCYTAC